MGENTSIFWTSLLLNMGAVLHSKQGNDGEPSTSLIHLWTAAIQSGHRAAMQSTSSADSFGGGAAVVGGLGAE
jgi:hypothetical protein